MLSHVSVGTRDTARAKVFYDAVFAPLGLELRVFEEQWVSWRKPGEDMPFFTVVRPFDDSEPSVGNGSMLAFLAPDRAAVDTAHAAAIAHGGVCEGKPGLRPHYHPHYYGAYFRDLDGNKIHVVCHEAPGDD